MGAKTEERGSGIPLAAESEHDIKMSEIARDFEKLLYVRSPVKLMLRLLDREIRLLEETRNEADPIKGAIESCMRTLRQTLPSLRSFLTPDRE